jgi:hypothetical protein
LPLPARIVSLAAPAEMRALAKTEGSSVIESYPRPVEIWMRRTEERGTE